MATKKWMETKGGDPATLVEPFLKEVQSNADPGPATFNSTWGGQLSTAQQAAVIVAVKAAAEGGC